MFVIYKVTEKNKNKEPFRAAAWKAKYIISFARKAANELRFSNIRDHDKQWSV